MSRAGDINDDGIDDFVIGAPVVYRNGEFGGSEAYVVFGSSSGFSASLDVTSLNGTNGFVVQGAAAPRVLAFRRAVLATSMMTALTT